jgi:tetratricopeptide (TPR) repeat protein
LTFDQLYADAMRLTSVDLKAASQAARKVKKAASSEPRHAGLSARLLGHIAFLQSKYRVAKEHYELSVRLFESANLMLEAAITRSGAVLTLTYLAEYTQLQGWVDQARAEFESTQDRARLARLDGNLAFGLFRQDKFAEALAMYERVLKELLETGRPVDVSTALWNKATCLISLGDYAAAGRAHLEARSYAEANKLPLQTAAIDYNVAYLHYLCGDYTDAMALYDVARRTGEPYRRALCDLDEAEMFLELNLHREAAGLAQRAMRSFQRLAMPYEQGKAIAFRGIAQGQLGLGRQALRTFGAARRTFLRERNDVWLALLDLYQAILLDRLGMTRKARQLAEKGA